MLLHWIWLATRQGLNERTKYELLRQFSAPEDIYRDTGAGYRDIPGINAQGLKSLMDKSLEQARGILDQCREKNIRVLTLEDPAYPHRLRGIHAPPVLLYCKGSLPDWQERPMIGAVGTRQASDYGVQAARQLGYELVAGGACLVSGVARGIDAAVLTGALEARGKPVIFLAGGLDVISPVENRWLYQQVEKQGCLLSEYPPGTQHLSWHYRERNRLISGIANGVLVVEAPEKSGALITARHAMEQGRDVFAVPGPIHSKTARGSNALLRDGAIMVMEGWDILENYQAAYPGKLQRLQASFQCENTPPQRGKSRSEEREHKKVIDKCPSPPYIDVETKPAATAQEQAILDLLMDGPKLADELIARSGVSYTEALSAMTVLELRGCLRRLPGNLIARNTKH